MESEFVALSVLSFLVTQHCDPPYRAIGYSYTYRIYVFQGIAGYRAIPPFWGWGGGVLRDYPVDVLKARGGGIAGQGCPLRYRAL